MGNAKGVLVHHFLRLGKITNKILEYSCQPPVFPVNGNIIHDVLKNAATEIIKEAI